MTNPSINIATVFISQVDELEVTRLKMEALLTGGEINLDDIEHMYCGLYIEAFTLFEALIEDLFIGLLNGDYLSSMTDVVNLVTITPVSKIQEILFAGKSYLDWLPYQEQTIKRSKSYFKDGYPFDRLDGNEKFSLLRLHRIRNAISHKSMFAQKKFQDEVIGNLTLLPRERKPGGFLKSVYRRSPVQTQFENSIQELKSITIKICT